jgi:arylsulfatase A-like enzyme
MARPNILFITSDQQRGDCYGFRGRNVSTPHLDLLASEGTSLETVITPCLVCQPARASILTGLLPRTHRVHDNGIDLEADIGEKGFAGSLSASGYRTAKIGKAHFATYHTFSDEARSVESIAGSRHVSADWTGPSMGFDYVQLMVVGHNWWLPEKPPGGLHYEPWYYGDGRGDLKNKLLWESSQDHKGAPQTWSSKLPVAWHNSTWTADRAIDFLREDHDKPFCLWVSFPDPHHPSDAPYPWAGLHRPEDVDLPEHRDRDLDNRPWWHKAAIESKIPAEHREIREKYSRMPKVSDEHLREIIANTYGQISLIDHSVGRILSALETAGLADNTFIVCTSDHGMVLKGPMPYEGLLNVRSIVKGPDIPAGKVNPEPLSTLDFGATFLDWAGAESLMNIHGRSARNVISGNETRDGALSEWELLPGRVGVGLSLRTVRTKTAKLTTEMNSQAAEMYDLTADPHELTNIFDSPEHAQLRDQLNSCS